MKRNLNSKGFAMVETLIAAVFIVSIFTLLYNLSAPIIGGYKANENYDDLDSKYIAFYIKEMIETDSNFKLSSINFNDAGNKSHTYKVRNMDEEYDDESIDKESYLCDNLTISNSKNNQYFCNKYLFLANVTNIYITNFDTTDFKNMIKNSTNYSRSFKNYVSYMPTHSAASSDKKNNYYRLIVEIENDSNNTSINKYYTYSSIEVRK